MVYSQKLETAYRLDGNRNWDPTSLMNDDGCGRVNREFLRAIDAAKEPKFLVGKMETEDDGKRRHQVGFALKRCLRERAMEIRSSM